MSKEIKQYTFCGEQTKKAINCDCGIFYFKDDVEKALKDQRKEIADKIDELNIKWGCEFLNGKEFDVLKDLIKLKNDLLRK